MIPTLLFLAAILWVASLEAHADVSAIAKNIRIDHAEQLLERCIAITVAACLIVLAWCVTFGPSFLGWRYTLWPVLAWGAFTPSFRYMLNKWRNLPTLYISPSNAYDRFWLRIGKDAAPAYATEIAVFIAALYTFTKL